MAVNIDAVNAYRGALNNNLKSGLDAPQDNNFKNLVSSQHQNGLGDVVTSMVSQAIETSHEAETQMKMAAQGQANPTEVAHTMRMAALNMEGVITTLGKGIEAYNKMLSMPV